MRRYDTPRVVHVFYIANGGGTGSTVVYITGGIAFIVIVSHSNWLNRVLTPIIKRTLSYATDLEIKDYSKLLGLRDDYRISETTVNRNEWLANETADELNLSDEGVLLLGIQREGTYIGAPGGDTEIKPGDTVVLYGKRDRLQELSERDEGNVSAHEDALDEHEETLEEQEQFIGQ